MRMKRFCCVLLIAAVLTAVSACANEIDVQTMSGQTYEVVGCHLTDEYADRMPEPGWQFLLVTIRGTEDDLDNIQATFFGSDSKAAVSDGTTTAECQLVVYAAGNGGNGSADAILLFAVPEDFGEDFEMYGPAFQSVALNIERR